MLFRSQGVNYRALGDLFNLAEKRKGTFVYDIAVQMIEIYNEQVRDLLTNDGLNKRYPYEVIFLSNSFSSFYYMLLSHGNPYTVIVSYQ